MYERRLAPLTVRTGSPSEVIVTVNGAANSESARYVTDFASNCRRPTTSNRASKKSNARITAMTDK